MTARLFITPRYLIIREALVRFALRAVPQGGRVAEGGGVRARRSRDSNPGCRDAAAAAGGQQRAPGPQAQGERTGAALGTPGTGKRREEGEN